MSQTHESPNDRPQPPPDDEATHTVPSPTTNTNRPPLPEPPIPLTDEQVERLRVIGPTLHQNLDDFDYLLRAMVMLLDHILSPEQRLSQPFTSLLESRERFGR